MHFITYPYKELPDLNGYFVLDLEAEPLSASDSHLGIFLIDGTWRHSETMARQIPNLPKRSLPKNLRTAYPRRQDDCSDPTRGLASIEALYMSYLILGRNTEGLLDHYHWKEAFLASLS